MPSKLRQHQKNKREEKVPTQIQNSSLGPKPFPIHMKQIRQREGKESWKSAKLRRDFVGNDGPFQNRWRLGILQCNYLHLPIKCL
jgi:hypothetical protein